MTTRNTDSKRPTHAAYHVDGEGKKARWTRIGAAWMHKDLKGANLEFQMIPLSGRIVIREITDRDEAAETNDADHGGQQ